MGRMRAATPDGKGARAATTMPVLQVTTAGQMGPCLGCMVRSLRDYIRPLTPITGMPDFHQLWHGR